MTIDEAIERCETLATKGHIIFSRDPDIAEECNEKYKQLAEWLEELKALKNGLDIKCDSLNKALEKGKKIGYNKALDDFVKFASDMPTVEEEDGTIRPMWLEEMAEQLKSGGNIELSEYSKSKGNRTGK